MACSVARSSLLRSPTVRHYAVAAAAQPSASSRLECKVATNNVTVATCDNDLPVAQVSIVFRTGSRNEKYNTQGVTHSLRIATGLSTSASSGFAIMRNIQQLGGNLMTTVDRESIAYTLQITRDNLSPALTFLEHVATKQIFKPWEVSDQLPRIEYELASLSDSTIVIELLHKAAYRTGLGYSLYTPKHQLGKIDSETLQHFVNTWFTGSNCAVVATGVPLPELTAFAMNLEVSSKNITSEASKYHGGELRKERASELTNVAVALEGVSLKNENDALACAILQRASGTGPRVKWGNSVSPLQKEVSKAAGSEPFALSSFNASYSDTGLFGFVLCSTPNVAGPITTVATKWLKSMEVSDSDIARGKAILKTEILEAADNGAALLESLQCQALHKGALTAPESLAASVEKVSASAIKSVANKMASGKLSMAAIGNLATVPYVDELK